MIAEYAIPDVDTNQDGGNVSSPYAFFQSVTVVNYANEEKHYNFNSYLQIENCTVQDNWSLKLLVASARF